MRVKNKARTHLPSASLSRSSAQSLLDLVEIRTSKRALLGGSVPLVIFLGLLKDTQNFSSPGLPKLSLLTL